jgi:hypothetical protein
MRVTGLSEVNAVSKQEFGGNIMVGGPLAFNSDCFNTISLLMAKLPVATYKNTLISIEYNLNVVRGCFNLK